MNKLLDRLKQVDPTTYAAFVDTELGKYDCHDDYGKMTEYIYQDRLINKAQMAWLQACLQTAIRSRGGWYWKISSQQLDSTGKYVCEIVKENGWRTVWVREEGNSPTEAMLAAYIAACEAI